MKITLFTVLTLPLFISCSPIEYKEYTVQLIFCDNRQPINVVLKLSNKPSNEDIKYWKRAVPTYQPSGYSNVYLNVCDIKVLEISK